MGDDDFVGEREGGGVVTEVMRRQECLRHLLAAEAVILVRRARGVVGVGYFRELVEVVVGVGGDDAAFPGAGFELAVGGVGVGWALGVRDSSCPNPGAS